MRMRSCALPPVTAKPKPSMGWYCWSSFTSIVGRVLADAEKCKGSFCRVSNWDRCGVGHHTRASPDSCALADIAEQSRTEHSVKASRGFMMPPLPEKTPAAASYPGYSPMAKTTDCLLACEH